MSLNPSDDDLPYEPMHVRELAEVLRSAQRDLDAQRGGASAHTRERQKLARKVDILSHLLASHRSPLSADGMALAEASKAPHLSTPEAVAKLPSAEDGPTGSEPPEATGEC